MNRDKLILIGPMGAGKSAVGRKIARQLGLTFIDSDEEIERRTGVDIPFIFEKEGEAGFRERESAVLAELLEAESFVLATGGGAVLSPENRRMLAASGVVIYLYTGVAEQVQRTRSSSHRPLLREDNPEQVLQNLMDLRDPLYREIATVTVSTDGQQVGTVSAEIRQKLNELPDSQETDE